MMWDYVETCIKTAYKMYKYRKYKEVYEIEIDVLKQIITKCNDIISFATKSKLIVSIILLLVSNIILGPLLLRSPNLIYIVLIYRDGKNQK